MITLKDLSIIWSLIHTLVLFLMLFESRYSRRKTIVLSCATMLPLIAINALFFIIKGPDAYMPKMLFMLSLPSLVFFWLMAKHRDGRFVFTFCLVDTTVLEIIYITNVISIFLPEEAFVIIFLIRLFIYPLIEYFLCRPLRIPYHNFQNHFKQGWWLFSLIGAGFYLAMTLSMSHPTMIAARLEDLPLTILLFILMPLSYMNIFLTLGIQQKASQAREQENILRLHADSLNKRLQESSASNERFRVERHDFRHKMNTIASMLEKEQYSELHALVQAYSQPSLESAAHRYCSNAVIDATLASYLQLAQSKGIKLKIKLAFPDKLPVNDAELATVFANAIENAIHACEKLETSKRWLEIRSLTAPCFMLQISNSYDGHVLLNEEGIPISSKREHGFGTRSIIAFCTKNHVFYEYKIDHKIFSLRLVFR